MPKTNAMLDALTKVSIVTPDTGADDRCAGAAAAISKFATYLSAPANSIGNEVNHRPAVQQWAVCTP